MDEQECRGELASPAVYFLSLSLCLSLYQSIHPSMRLSLGIYVSVSIDLSICLFLSLSLSLSVSLCLSPSLSVSLCLLFSSPLSLSLSLFLSPGLWCRELSPYTARVCAPDCCGAKELHGVQRQHSRVLHECSPQQLESMPWKKGEALSLSLSLYEVRRKGSVQAPPPPRTVRAPAALGRWRPPPGTQRLHKAQSKKNPPRVRTKTHRQSARAQVAKYPSPLSLSLSLCLSVSLSLSLSFNTARGVRACRPLARIRALRD